MRTTRLAVIMAAWVLLAACGNPRTKALTDLRNNPTLFVPIAPVSLASLAAAQLKKGDGEVATNDFRPVFLTVNVFQGSAVHVYEHETDVPGKTTCQPMTASQLMVALTNAPHIKGIMFRSMVITTNELARIRAGMTMREDESFRIIRTR